MTHSHSGLGHRFAEIVSAHDATRFSEIVTPDYVNHNPYAEQGLAGVIGFFSHFIQAFPDVIVTAEDVFVSEDGTRIVGRYGYAGTHSGTFMGYPATGRPFTMRSIDVWRVEAGMLVEHWDELNTLDVFAQIGGAQILPPPEGRAAA